MTGLIWIQAVCHSDSVPETANVEKSQMTKSYQELIYSKCSKISNTSYLPKRLRQTGQTQMRLQKWYDQGLPLLLF